MTYNYFNLCPNCKEETNKEEIYIQYVYEALCPKCLHHYLKKAEDFKLIEKHEIQNLEIEKLADYIIKHFPNRINEGSTVDVAINIMEDIRRLGVNK